MTLSDPLEEAAASARLGRPSPPLFGRLAAREAEIDIKCQGLSLSYHTTVLHSADTDTGGPQLLCKAFESPRPTRVEAKAAAAWLLKLAVRLKSDATPSHAMLQGHSAQESLCQKLLRSRLTDDLARLQEGARARAHSRRVPGLAFLHELESFPDSVTPRLKSQRGRGRDRDPAWA